MVLTGRDLARAEAAADGLRAETGGEVAGLNLSRESLADSSRPGQTTRQTPPRRGSPTPSSSPVGVRVTVCTPPKNMLRAFHRV